MFWYQRGALWVLKWVRLCVGRADPTYVEDSYFSTGFYIFVPINVKDFESWGKLFCPWLYCEFLFFLMSGINVAHLESWGNCFTLWLCGNPVFVLFIFLLDMNIEYFESWKKNFRLELYGKILIFLFFYVWHQRGAFQIPGKFLWLRLCVKFFCFSLFSCLASTWRD